MGRGAVNVDLTSVFASKFLVADHTKEIPLSRVGRNCQGSREGLGLQMCAANYNGLVI